MSRRKKRNSANKYMVQSDEPPPCPHAEKSITPNKTKRVTDVFTPFERRFVESFDPETLIFTYFTVKNNFPHAVFGRCSECSIKEKIYLCLKCGKQFCTTHGDKHFDLNNHSLNFELDTAVVRCSKCARDLAVQSHSSILRVSNLIGDFLKKQNATAGVVSPKKEPVVVEQKHTNGTVDSPKDTTREAVPEVTLTEHYVIGLKNTGVICFFNSVLQNLVQTPMLRACMNYTSDNYKDTLVSKTYGTVHINVASGTASSMVTKYKSLLKLLDFKERGSKAIHAYQVFQEMCSYNGCLSDGQQDAQEAFHAIVHSMSSEESKRRKNAVLQTFGIIRATYKDLPKEKRKKITEFANLARSGSFIDSLFGGTTINQITCLTCSRVTKTLDHFVDLSVPLPKKGENKSRSKQKSSGDDGLSKHQKKKQQKENRKKGKKGRDRKDSSYPAQPDSPLDLSNGNADPMSPNSSMSCPPSPQINPIQSPEPTELSNNVNVASEKPLQGADNFPSPKVWSEDICTVMNGVESDTDCTTATVESETIAVEEVQIEFDDDDVADICLELPLENGADKVESGVRDTEVNGKLIGGYSASCGSEDENDGMLFSLFNEDNEESSNGTKSSVENLANQMGDLDIGNDTLDIDEADFGTDTLDACLAQFCREELLTGDNQFSCANCARQCIDNNSLNISCARSTDSSMSDDENSDDSDSEEKIKPVLRDAKCRYFLNTLPPILVIHLKRFTQDHKGFLIKDRRHINYPLVLDLDKFIISGSGNKYKLFGVVDHSGTLHRGHYTAYVRKRDTRMDESFKDKSVPLPELINLLGTLNAEKENDYDKWYFCNDERISETTVKRVLNADAYLLFYERCLPYS